MRKVPLSLLLAAVLLLKLGASAVITGACDKDMQCGGGMCCAVSLWIKSIRMCTPLGREGDDCHPLSHRVPYFGKRVHHTCPCLPNLTCTKLDESTYRCLPFLHNKRSLFLRDVLQQTKI
uniref:Prokineticin domain-containing protein n=1 Tax=Leptobrachium leishanense TaxID=445787 RepID=A0A8C5R3L5_9ANUR